MRAGSPLVAVLGIVIMAVRVVRIVFHDLVAVRDEQADGERAGELADHLVDPQARCGVPGVAGLVAV